MNRLVCSKCKTNWTTAPEGATIKTQFVCRECSPIGIAEESYFDRFQFDGAGALPYAGKEEIASLIGVAGSFSGLVTAADLLPRGAVERRSFLDNALLAPRPASLRIIEAQKAGERWALVASRKNLALLPDNQRVALVSFYWAGLEHSEIAKILDTTEEYSRKLVSAAIGNLADLVS